jgi:hypothetical protein
MDYKQLLDVIEYRKGLELKLSKAKEAFNKSIELEKAMLDDILEKEEILRREVLLEMKENNVENADYEGHKIVRNVRITNQITNADVFATAVARHKKAIKELGITDEQINHLFANEVVVTDKKLAQTIINNYQKINSSLLDGVTPQVTEFITVT